MTTIAWGTEALQSVPTGFLSPRDPRTRTADLGGTASTGEVTDFVAALLLKERASK